MVFPLLVWSPERIPCLLFEITHFSVYRHFFHGSYEDVVHDLLPTKDDRELGLIFVDPSGNLPDFEGALRYVAEVRPRMDILIYIATTNVKRQKKKRLNDYMACVGKSNWLIRNPISWDQFKWTFLLGSNYPIFKDYKSIQLVRVESERGQQILERLTLTEAEQFELKQGKLF